MNVWLVGWMFAAKLYTGFMNKIYTYFNSFFQIQTKFVKKPKNFHVLEFNLKKIPKNQNY